MIASDVVLIGALLVCVVVWWMRHAPARTMVLLLTAVIALVSAVYGVSVDRWQATFGLVASSIFLVALLIGRIRRAPRHDRVPFISGTLLAIIALLAGAAIYLYPVTDLPKPSGPHPVGVRTFELVDASRRGVWGAAENEPRRLLVRVWYPAGSVAGLTPRPYFNAAEANYTARSMGQLFSFPPFLAYVRHVRTNSYEDVPLLAGASALPTVIYSHGYTSFLSQNTALMEELASHGYAVYSIQHTYDSSATVFPDGEVAPMDPALIALMLAAETEAIPESMLKGFTSQEFDQRLAGQLQQVKDSLARGDRVMQSASIWVADRLFVHGRLQQHAVPGDIAPIVAASNFERVGEMGMSFGGSTTGAVCLIDRRCAAGVNLDGANFHFLPFDADMPPPFLMLHSDISRFYRTLKADAAGLERSFNDFSYESFGNAGERGDLYRLQVKGAAHLGVSDFTWFMRRPVRNALLGTTPADVTIGVQNDFVRGFFDKHLRGIANEFPQAEYRKYAGWALPYDNRPVRDWWLSKSAAQRQEWLSAIDELKRRISYPTPVAPAPGTSE